MPITWPAALTVGPPESPGRMFASTWISPPRVSVLPVSASFADTVWFSAPMRPSSTLGVPPAPPALPSATTGSPTETVRVADVRRRQSAAGELQDRDVVLAVVTDHVGRDRSDRWRSTSR